MARYLVQVPRDVLAESRKAEVAKAIVAAHHKITGDDPDSVQVAVTEIDAGCFFAGGRSSNATTSSYTATSPARRPSGSKP